MSRLTRRAVAGTYPVAASIQPAGQWDLLPGGHRILGINIVGRSSASAALASNAWLGDFWYLWEWTAWIKPQVDAAKALGANTIRIFGSQAPRAGSGSPYANSLDTATYLARWDQLLAYCRSQGLYVYPTLGSDSNQEDGPAYTYTPTLSWFQGEYALVVRFLRKYRDIIPAVEIANESFNWLGTAGQGHSLYLTCKQEAPDLKFGWSKYFTSAPPTAPSAGDVPSANSYDFLAFHLYYDAGATDLDSYLSNYNVPVVVSEFGTTASALTAARQSRYNAIKALSANVTSGRQVAGAIAWNMRDQDTVSSNQWGLADASGTLRTDVSTIFSTFPA